jgi:hypothetical protein
MDFDKISRVVDCFVTKAPQSPHRCVVFTCHKDEILEQFFGEYWFFGKIDEVSDDIMAQVDDVKLCYNSYSFHYDIFKRGDEEKHELSVCFADPGEAIHFRLKHVQGR